MAFKFINRLFGSSPGVDDESEREQFDDIAPPGLRQSLNPAHGIDTLPDAAGSFGRDPRNPVPANGIRGELKYLNRLLCPCRSNLFGHRIGHASFPSASRPTDVYETVCVEMKHWDLVFVHMYHPRRSHLLPEGYSRIQFHPRISRTIMGGAVNQFCPNFPVGMPPMISRMLGQDLAKPVIENFAHALQYPDRCRRPDTQREAMRLMLLSGLFSGYVAMKDREGQESWIQASTAPRRSDSSTGESA